MNKDKITLGIDIGGTKISAAAVLNGEISGEILKIATPKTSPDIINTIEKIAMDFKNKFSISAIGIATAGVVDTDKGCVLSATENLSCGYSGTNYKVLLENNLAIPVIVDNDANAAAYGEYKYGSAKVTNNCIVITLGTGIGSGIIIDGKLYRGNCFSAGECGHIPINIGFKVRCNCGKYNCWESFASGNGLKNLASIIYSNRDHWEDFDWKIEKQPKEEVFSSYKIIEGYKNKNNFYSMVFASWHDYLSYGIITLANILSPECIVLGGSMSEFVDYQLLNKLVDGQSPAKYNIKKAKLSNNAGMIGIASLASEILLN